MVYNKLAKGNEFNNYFTNIGLKQTNKIQSPVDKSYIDYFTNPVTLEFQFKPKNNLIISNYLTHLSQNQVVDMFKFQINS